MTKEEIKEYYKDYYKTNKDKIKECHKEYRKNNKEHIKEQGILYYINNKEKINIQKKEYNKANKTKINERQKEYTKNNKEKIKERVKKYRENNKVKYNSHQNEYCKKINKEKRKTNLNFKLVGNLKNEINRVLKGISKSSHTLKLIGIPNIEFLWQHFEKQFNSNMTRENYGTYWEVDHIRPCAMYNFICPAQQFMCFNYINLQPLEKNLNRIKHDKSPEEWEKYKTKLNI